MQDDTQKLEAELERLSPAPVPEAFEERVFAIFDRQGEAAAPEGDIIPFPIWQRLGTAAAVLIGCVGIGFAVLNNFGPAREPVATGSGKGLAPVGAIAPAAKNFVPASANNTLRGVSDGGVFLDPDGKPVRELRYQFSDSYRWKAGDGSELELKIPRERSYIVPVPTD